MRSKMIALIAGLAGCALAGPALANVTYLFTPTLVTIPQAPSANTAIQTTPSGTTCSNGGCVAWNGILTLTFTDSAVAGGASSFEGAPVLRACGTNLTCAELLVAKSGFVSATGNDGALGDRQEYAFDAGLDLHGESGFDLAFNPNGTLSGNLSLGDGQGDGTEIMSSAPSGVWSGEGGTCSVAGVAYDDMCGLVGSWAIDAAVSDPVTPGSDAGGDPASVPAPSALMLLATALALFAVGAPRKARTL